MARRYTFGQANSGSRNLSSLIQSLSNSMLDQQDSEEFDAFNNGGPGPDGKPVTADSLIAYIKGRIGDYQQGDPDYIKWQDKLTQTQFSIGENNITMLYNAGKVSAGAVANWYRSQLKNAPAGSGFYTSIENKISQFNKAGAASAAGSATTALYNKLAPLYAAGEKSNAMDTAVATELLAAGKAHPYGDGTHISDYDPGDVEALVNSKTTLTLADGSTVPFSMSIWAAADQTGLQSWQRAAALITASGRTVPPDLTNNIKNARLAVQGNNGIDVRAKADYINSALQDNLKRDAGDPVAMQKDLKDAASQLQALQGTKGYGAADPVTQGGIAATVQVWLGNGKPGMTDWNGVSLGTQDQQSGKLSNDLGVVTDVTSAAAGIADHTLTMAQTTVGGPMQAVPTDSVGGVDTTVGAYLGGDGQIHVGVFKGSPIYGSQVVDKSGNPVAAAVGMSPQQVAALVAANPGYSLKPDTSRPLGYTFGSPAAVGGGKSIPIVGIYDSAGTMHFPPGGSPYGQLLPDGNVLLGPDGMPVPATDPKTGQPIDITSTVTNAPTILGGPGVNATDLTQLDNTPDKVNDGNSVLGTPVGGLTGVISGYIPLDVQQISGIKEGDEVPASTQAILDHNTAYANSQAEALSQQQEFASHPGDASQMAPTGITKSVRLGITGTLGTAPVAPTPWGPSSYVDPATAASNPSAADNPSVAYHGYANPVIKAPTPSNPTPSTTVTPPAIVLGTPPNLSALNDTINGPEAIGNPYSAEVNSGVPKTTRAF